MPTHSARRPRTLSGRPTLIWARMKVFRTSLFVADEEKALHRRRVRVGRTNNVLRTPGRKRAPGKLSYGPKVGHPLNVTSECDVLWTTLAEWVELIQNTKCVQNTKLKNINII